MGTKGENARNADRLTGKVDWLLAAIVLTALILRLAAAFQWNLRVPDDIRSLSGDEPGYAELARGIVQGNGYPGLVRVPIYPLFLAAVLWASHESYHWVRYAQCLVSAVTVFLVYVLGRKLFGRAAGIAAAVLVSCFSPLIVQPLMVMTEAIYTPVILLVVLFSVRAYQSPTRINAVLLGAMIGISDLIRPTLLLYPVFILIVVALTPARKTLLQQAAIMIAATGLMIAPWTIRNFVKYRVFVPLTVTNAFAWQGSPEYYHLLYDRGYTYMRIWTEVLYPPGGQNPDPSTVEGDRYWTSRALRSITAEPWLYLRYTGEKLVTYWTGDPAADWAGKPFSYSGLVGRGYLPLRAALLIAARAVPLIALVAILILHFHSRKLLLIYMLLAFVTLFHAALCAVIRLSEPFLPLILLLIAGATLQVTRRSPILSKLDKADAGWTIAESHLDVTAKAGCPISRSL